jgi:hypothetical protein
MIFEPSCQVHPGTLTELVGVDLVFQALGVDAPEPSDDYFGLDKSVDDWIERDEVGHNINASSASADMMALTTPAVDAMKHPVANQQSRQFARRVIDRVLLPDLQALRRVAMARAATFHWRAFQLSSRFSKIREAASSTRCRAAASSRSICDIVASTIFLRARPRYRKIEYNVT